jgi:hypothetical protein
MPTWPSTLPEDDMKANHKPEDISLKMDDLKSVFGDRFKVAYVRSSIIPGASSSLMIPANEPCPTEPHNHDKLALDRGLQKYIVIEL